MCLHGHMIKGGFGRCDRLPPGEAFTGSLHAVAVRVGRSNAHRRSDNAPKSAPWSGELVRVALGCAHSFDLRVTEHTAPLVPTQLELHEIFVAGDGNNGPCVARFQV